MDSQTTPLPTTQPSAKVRSTASFQAWLVLVGAGVAIGTRWLLPNPLSLGPGLQAYVALALLSSVVTLALPPALMQYLVVRWVRSERLAGWLHGVIGAGFLGLLYTDTVIYRLLRYHVNGAVLNVFKTKGSEDSIHLGPRVWLTACLSLTAMTLAQRYLYGQFLRRSRRRERDGMRSRWILRPRTIALLFVLPTLFVDKSVWAAATIDDDPAVVVACRDLPLYPRVRLSRLLGIDGQDQPLPELLPRDAKLAYPHGWPRLDPGGRRPNILLLVVDSWRRDTFTAANTPRLFEFSQESRVFADHLSGGNGTRFAVFSLLYGLHGSYWFPVLEAGRPPVLLDSLRTAGYELRVFSSASMNFPEFRQTAWVGMSEEAIQDEHGTRAPDEADRIVAQKIESWLGERSGTEPFFCFVLLDSPHQPYSSPPGGPFQPSADQLDYLELAGSLDPGLAERLFNRYRNSVLHADQVAGRILDALTQHDLLEDTLVVVTGDHGEEFHECGYWGHTSNFSPEQTEVPFLMRGPGIEPGVEGRPSSHVDLPATLLELLGADPAGRHEWCLGESLLDLPERRVRVLSGWADIGLACGEEILRIPFEPLAHEIELYDRRWVLQGDSSERLRAHTSDIESLAADCARFLGAQP